MKRLIALGLLLMLVTACTSSASASQNSASSAPQIFTVLVGVDDPANSANIEAFLPATVHIHVGDTVVWKQNAKEIHTVTFLAGTKEPEFVVPAPGAPQGAMMMNPQAAFPTGPKNGKYDGSSYANSGVMGPDQGQSQQWQLTFTKAGTYTYLCTIHDQEKMMGTIVVEAPGTAIASPAEVTAQGQKEADALLAQVPDVVKEANADVKPDIKNADGTMTHFVLVGYSKGHIDLETFLPAKVDVKPGDTVTWMFDKADIAPHTISFLNGAKIPDLVVPQPQKNGPPLLLLNPAVGAPMNVDKPLTNQGVVNSGFIDPSAPMPHTFSLKIGNVTGDIPYLCELHYASGMKGTISVAAQTAN
jgi:plastocyanin